MELEKWLVTFWKVTTGDALKPAIEPYHKVRPTRHKASKLHCWPYFLEVGRGFTYLHKCCRLRLMVTMWLQDLQINKSFTSFLWLLMWGGTLRCYVGIIYLHLEVDKCMDQWVALPNSRHRKGTHVCPIRHLDLNWLIFPETKGLWHMHPTLLWFHWLKSVYPLLGALIYNHPLFGATWWWQDQRDAWNTCMLNIELASVNKTDAVPNIKIYRDLTCMRAAWNWC